MWTVNGWKRMDQCGALKMSIGLFWTELTTYVFTWAKRSVLPKELASSIYSREHHAESSVKMDRSGALKKPMGFYRINYLYLHMSFRSSPSRRAIAGSLPLIKQIGAAINIYRGSRCESIFALATQLDSGTNLLSALRTHARARYPNYINYITV